VTKKKSLIQLIFTLWYTWPSF